MTTTVKKTKAIPKARKRILLPKAELKKYQKWIKDIHDGEYRPFIETNQIHSIGRKHKFFCKKQQRIIHLISDGEWRFYNQTIWEANVVKIEEQYALNINETFAEATRLKIAHPYEYERDIHHIMTTDMVVTYQQSGAFTKKAFSVKYSNNPEAQTRVNKKSEIERAYWESRDIPFNTISAIDIEKAEIKKLDFLSLHYDPSIADKALLHYSDLFLKFWHTVRNLKLRALITAIAQKMQLTQFAAEKLFKNAVLRKYINVPANAEISFHKPLRLI